jgi:hypothetical protein
MLTIFSTPKPFRGHIEIIQRNAIQSWKRLNPGVEVILIGDEEGTSEMAREFGLRHEPTVRRNEHGTKYLGYIFDHAEEVARHSLLCYVNCDILLTSDFYAALERVMRWRRNFLMVGRRWDTDIATPWDFSQLGWEAQLRSLALKQNRQRPAQWIDYFVFTRGLYSNKIPPFVIGRPGWDNWLVWFARASRVPVVDASRVVIAVHQNHDYSYHPQGEQGVWQGEEAQRNYALLGGWPCFRTIENTTHQLTRDGIKLNFRHWYALAKRASIHESSGAWFAFLSATRSVRHRFGLRQENIRRLSRGSAGAGPGGPGNRPS